MPIKNNLQTKIIEDLKHSHEFLLTLTPSEKIAKVVELQDQYYQMLKALEQNGGRAIPEK